MPFGSEVQCCIGVLSCHPPQVENTTTSISGSVIARAASKNFQSGGTNSNKIRSIQTDGKQFKQWRLDAEVLEEKDE
jgi:hypothetical protein